MQEAAPGKPSDARSGDDEIFVILPGQGSEEAYRVAEACWRAWPEAMVTDSRWTSGSRSIWRTGRTPRSHGRDPEGWKMAIASAEAASWSPIEPGARAIAIFNSLLVKEGGADWFVERFCESRGNVQGFPGFISMEVLRADAGDEVLVVTRWRDREAFDAWVRSDAFAKAHGRGGSEGLLGGTPG